jgi:hypothetical protein
MFRTLLFVVAVSLFAGAGTISRADPVTYNFTGTLNQPMNGTNQFSGSFTFNADPSQSSVGGIVITQTTISTATNGVSVAQPAAYGFEAASAGTPAIAEFGNDVSLTVNIGGQVLNFANTAANPFLATFQASMQTFPTQQGQPTTPPLDNISINGVSTSFSPGNSFSNNSFNMSFSVRPTTLFENLAPGQIVNFGNFNFATTFQGLGAADSAGGSYSGTLTSIELVSAPEPGTFAVFGMMGIAAGLSRVYRKKSKSRAALAE